MPELDITDYAKLPPADLETMRRNIVTKASGNHENLSLEELHVLAAITGVLRRRSSGPPKVVKEKKGPKAKAAPATIEDLA